MKKIIKKLLPGLIILLLILSVVGNCFLLNHNNHLSKKVDTLNEKLAEYNEDYIKYADLYNKCEQDLNGTMESLQKVTDELNTLKKN